MQPSNTVWSNVLTLNTVFCQEFVWRPNSGQHRPSLSSVWMEWQWCVVWLTVVSQLLSQTISGPIRNIYSWHRKKGVFRLPVNNGERYFSEDLPGNVDIAIEHLFKKWHLHVMIWARYIKNKARSFLLRESSYHKFYCIKLGFFHRAKVGVIHFGGISREIFCHACH